MNSFETMEVMRDAGGDAHKFALYISSFQSMERNVVGKIHLDLSKRSKWHPDAIRCISWYMHTYDQYQIPAKMRKTSKGSTVSDAADFLLFNSACERKSWVVGHVRKRCHRLMKELVATWYTEGYITKTQDLFHKSAMFKEYWQHAQEKRDSESHENNIYGTGDRSTKRKSESPEAIEGENKRLRYEAIRTNNAIVGISNHEDLGEGWIRVDENTSASAPTAHAAHQIIPSQLVAGAVNPSNMREASLSTPNRKDSSIVNYVPMNDPHVDLSGVLYEASLSKDESSPHSTIMPNDFGTPMIYPALPETPPSRLSLENNSPLQSPGISCEENNKLPSYDKARGNSDMDEEKQKLDYPLKEAAIHTMLRQFQNILTMLTLENGLWVIIPADRLFDDSNFHIWYNQKFGIDSHEGLRFHYMDSISSTTPVDVGPSDVESITLKQNLFLDFIQTYNYWNGHLHKYRVLVVPERLVNLSNNSQRKYPFQDKEGLFAFYDDSEQNIPSSSRIQSSTLNSQNQTTYRKKEKLKSNIEATGSSSLPHTSGSPSSEQKERGIKLPALHPPINFPLRHLPQLRGIDIGASLGHLGRYQVPDPLVVARVQKIDGKFSVPLHNAPLGLTVKVQEFFTWFVRFASHPSAAVPNLLVVFFKDAVPPMQYEIRQGDETSFQNMAGSILPQCRRAISMMSHMNEFVILIKAPRWHVATS